LARIAPVQTGNADPFTLWHWLGFWCLVVLLLALDLGVFHRRSREPSLRDAAVSTGMWCCLALAFNVYIWCVSGQKLAIEFLNGYLVEWTLSMDNVFVFAVIFQYFKVPLKYQYRVLFWGIMGAVVLRVVFILAATWLMKVHWAIYILGVFLIYTGAKLLRHDDEFDPEASWVIRVSRKLFRVSRERHGHQFFAREGGRFCITPLFLVLLVIDFIDVVFAIDSVPAIVGLSEENFVRVTSNVFAILGLRALYFLLAGTMDMFRYLRFGLSAILIFVGVKMLASEWIKVPPLAALAVVLSFLAIAIAASMVASRREPTAARVRNSPEDLFAGEPPDDLPPAERDDHSAVSQAATAPRE
jgi:tellurite resistance protein TerC